MMKTEKTIQTEIFNRINSRPDCRLFRNNIGLAYLGKIVNKTGRQITIQDYRPVMFGLQKGSGDLIGWKTVEITPEMVGKKIAVFTSIEAKAPNKKPTPAQKTWIQNVLRAGGRAGVATSAEGAEKII